MRLWLSDGERRSALDLVSSPGLGVREAQLARVAGGPVQLRLRLVLLQENHLRLLLPSLAQSRFGALVAFSVEVTAALMETRRVLALVQVAVEVSFFDLNVSDRVARLLRFLSNSFTSASTLLPHFRLCLQETLVALNLDPVQLLLRFPESVLQQVLASVRISEATVLAQVTVAHQNVHFFLCRVHRLSLLKAAAQVGHHLHRLDLRHLLERVSVDRLDLDSGDFGLDCLSNGLAFWLRFRGGLVVVFFGLRRVGAEP